jgi:hypothetical protein
MALVLWSGGCDSTLILHDLLTACHNGAVLKQDWRGHFVTLNNGDWVNAISIDHPQVGGNLGNRHARRRLYPLLRKKFGSFRCGEITIKQKMIEVHHTGDGLTQPGLWLLHACSYLRNDEDLYIGYIKGDDLWHYKEHLIEAFNAIQKFTSRTGVLRFPLEWTSKAEVISRLKHARLLSRTWHCERTEFPSNACGKCASCITHRTAMWRLKMGYEKYPKPLARDLRKKNYILDQPAKCVYELDRDEKESVKTDEPSTGRKLPVRLVAHPGRNGARIRHCRRSTSGR